jgi:hypothetical protein
LNYSEEAASIILVIILGIVRHVSVLIVLPHFFYSKCTKFISTSYLFSLVRCLPEWLWSLTAKAAFLLATSEAERLAASAIEHFVISLPVDPKLASRTLLGLSRQGDGLLNIALEERVKA